MWLNVLLVLVVLVDFSVLANSEGRKFGETCLPGTCASPLICLPTVKKCGCGTGQYDLKTKTCVAHPNDKCFDSSTCPANTTCEEPFAIQYPESVVVHFQKLGRSIGKIGSNSFCKCKRGLEFNRITKQCVPALQLNQPCSDKLEKEGHICEKRARLTCATNGTCQCYSNKTAYDPELHTCVVPLGSFCTILSHCVQNAWCSRVKDRIMERFSRDYLPESYFAREGDNKMSEIMKIRNSKCECILGYKQNSAGKCLPDYHVECSAKIPCYHESLDCVNGICQCKRGLNGRYMIFPNNNVSGCYLTEGTSCSEDSSPQCAPHSTWTKGICHCDAGLTPNQEGRCHLSHGSVCISPSTINGTMNIPEPYCNQGIGLACVDGKCACVDSELKWNDKRKECVAGEGRLCGHLDLVETEDIIHSRLYPLHPFVEDHWRRRKGNLLTFFTIGCAQGLHCLPESDYMYGPMKCTKEDARPRPTNLT